MDKKVPWQDVYKDFRQKFPNLSKSVVHYHPIGYGQILLILDNGEKMLYDYDDKTAWFIKEYEEGE